MLMKKILNVSEMKHVRGGAVPSDYCNPGDVLFTCATGYNSGFITKGVACGRDAREVASRIRDQRIFESPNLEYNGINVNCW